MLPMSTKPTNECFLVISALSPVPLNKWNLPKVDGQTQQTELTQVFCGGDLAGSADTTVESVNDGKTAAWFMHCYLQVCRIIITLNIFDVPANLKLDSILGYTIRHPTRDSTVSLGY